jgi:hypothetical protein
MKLEVFVGSSSESLNVANAIKHLLDSDDIECTVWAKESFFRLSHSTIETLTVAVDRFDAGIFVFADDDEIVSRGVDFSAPRDNVIFEHGLFCGHLGPKRTFVVRAKSRELKWLSDLEGFLPARYDDALAKSDAEASVKTACDLIRNELLLLPARCGIYANGEWKRFGPDWWTYRCAETSSTVIDSESVEVFTPDNVGLRFPRHDNLSARGRFCAVRLAPTSSGGDTRFYFSLRARNELVFLSLADSHRNEGWGNPQNEFMIQLPHLEANRYLSVVLDLDRLERFIGRTSMVNGFRLRPGIKVSHVCVLDELPIWLKEARALYPSTAPLIAIDDPAPDALVDQEQVVAGSLENLQKSAVTANDIQVFVLSPDGFWYPQGNLSIANGRWRVKAYFGNKEGGAGGEFQIAALTTDGQRHRDKAKELPTALGRSVVRVTRKR